jgi:hypothetical protein
VWPLLRKFSTPPEQRKFSTPPGQRKFSTPPGYSSPRAGGSEDSPRHHCDDPTWGKVAQGDGLTLGRPYLCETRGAAPPGAQYELTQHSCAPATSPGPWAGENRNCHTHFTRLETVSNRIKTVSNRIKSVSNCFKRVSIYTLSTLCQQLIYTLLKSHIEYWRAQDTLGGHCHGLFQAPHRKNHIPEVKVELPRPTRCLVDPNRHVSRSASSQI